jgi:hypothetical protein
MGRGSWPWKCDERRLAEIRERADKEGFGDAFGDRDWLLKRIAALVAEVDLWKDNYRVSVQLNDELTQDGIKERDRILEAALLRIKQWRIVGPLTSEQGSQCLQMQLVAAAALADSTSQKTGVKNGL